MAWWVLEDVALREALRRAQAGEDIGVIEAELYANSAAEQVPPDDGEG